MAGFNVKIICPDKLVFDGQATFLKIRTLTGDIGISGKHSDYFSIIQASRCELTVDGQKRIAACAEGYISIINELVKLVVTTFEWDGELDIIRAENALNKANDAISLLNKKDKEYGLMQEKFKRAKNRISIIQK